MSEGARPDTFYDSGTREGEAGRIADPEAAHDLAQAQEDQGMAAMARRETDLQRQHEGLKSSEEENNDKLMDSLKEKYPNAFMDLVDDKGRRLLLLNPANGASAALWHKSKLLDQYLIYTQCGVAAMSSDNIMPAKHSELFKNNDLNLTPIVDGLLTVRFPETRVVVELQNKKQPSESVTVTVQKLDLKDQKVREALKDVHQNEQKWASARIVSERAAMQLIPAEELIEEL